MKLLVSGKGEDRLNRALHAPSLGGRAARFSKAQSHKTTWLPGGLPPELQSPPRGARAPRKRDFDLSQGPVRTGLQLLLRKEVIQPQVPLRLPCYDFIPVTSFTLGPLPDTSGATGFHDVTGGVYKTRERIHGAVADAPLLAIPASWRRVAASNPNWAQFCRFPPPRGLGSHCTGHCSTCAALGVRAILT